MRFEPRDASWLVVLLSLASKACNLKPQSKVWDINNDKSRAEAWLGLNLAIVATVVDILMGHAVCRVLDEMLGLQLAARVVCSLEVFTMSRSFLGP